jgi:hypothetical protein
LDCGSEIYAYDQELTFTFYDEEIQINRCSIIYLSIFHSNYEMLKYLMKTL